VSRKKEIQRRLQSAIAEAALRHGRRVTSEMRAEVVKVCSTILSEYTETEYPKIALDPIQKDDGSVTFWVGGLPPMQLLPGEDTEE
jgi:hypothetical protein